MDRKRLALHRELIKDHRDAIQVREVRLAAQRILATHLRPGENPDTRP